MENIIEVSINDGELVSLQQFLNELQYHAAIYSLAAFGVCRGAGLLDERTELLEVIIKAILSHELTKGIDIKKISILDNVCEHHYEIVVVSTGAKNSFIYN